MKYFTLSEVLRSVPLTLLAGAIFALLKNLHSETIRCIMGMCDIKAFIESKISKTKYKFTAETRYMKAQKIISDIYYFFFFVAFGLAILILDYILADGIPRLYILLLFIAFYAAFGKIFQKQIGFVSCLFSQILKRTFFYTVYLIILIPLRLVVKKIQRKKITVKTP